MKVIAIYPGRFQPFHLGHKSVYDVLVRQFGVENVYIATSDKVDPPRSPFNFAEKQQIIAATGVDRNRVVQTRDPYKALEITSQFDPQDTKLLFAVSAKDMAEDPRFKSWTRRDGSPAYFQPAPSKVSEMEDFDKHGYIFVVPTLDFKVDGKPMRSATEFRREFAAADTATKTKMTRGILGTDDPSLVKLLASRITEGNKMKLNDVVNETTAGAIGSVVAPLGATQRRKVKEVDNNKKPTPGDVLDHARRAREHTGQKPIKEAAGFDPKVQELQNELIARGAKIKADGYMGPATEKAMKQFGGAQAAPANSAAKINTQPTKQGANSVTGVSNKAMQLVKNLETFTPTAKWDSKQWSNGFGTKAESPTGGPTDTKPRETITQPEAEARMADAMNKSAKYVIAFGKKHGYNWGQNQVDALTSFIYNGGPGWLNQVTNNGTRSNAEIAEYLPQYNVAGGRVLPGLNKRRQIELSMFTTGLADITTNMASATAQPAVSESTGQQLSVEQLATISDEALDRAYHYGRSSPGNTFGWQANLKSAAFAKKIIDSGVTDIEKISDAIHRGWNVTAQAFVKDPMQFDDSKTMAQEKLQAKLAQREKLMTQKYAQLPEDEKEKDRVVARALLQAITGDKPAVSESSQRVDRLVTRSLRIMRGGSTADAVAALKTVLGEMEYNERPQFYDFFIKQMVDMYGKQGNLKEFAPGNGGGESGRWYTDDQMTDLVGDGWWNDLDISGDISKQEMIQEAQAWLDDQGYSVHVLNCKVNDDDMEWYIEGSFQNSRFAKKGVAEGGPFSYGKKAPRKGSVADLAAQKRKEQDKKTPPIEPKDQMVGNAKVTKDVKEEWSQKYKNSINCKHPKGFSQKAHCAGKRKHTESTVMEMTCPDCGMCKSHGTLSEIRKGQPDSNGYTKCWPGKHAEGTKKGKNGGQVRNCVPNKSVTESFHDSVTFEIDNENAFNHVMGRFNSRIDWDGEYLVAPRRYWGAIQELAHEAGGEANEISDEHSMAEDMRTKADFRREIDSTVADFLARGGEIETVPPNRVRVKPGQSLASKHIGSKRETGRIVGKGRQVHGNKPVVNVSEVNDYFKRRKDEEDRIAGVKPPTKNKKDPAKTDYQQRRNREQQVAEAKQKPSAQERFNKRLKTKHGIDLDAMERQWAERTKKIEAEIAALRKQEKQVSESYYQINEDWKTAVAGAALAGAAALGGGAQAADLSHYNTEYLQKAADENRFGRYMISVDDAKAELQARANGKQQSVTQPTATQIPAAQQARADYIKKLPQVDSVERNGEQVNVTHDGKEYQGTVLQPNDPRPRFGPGTVQARVEAAQLGFRGLGSYVVYFVNNRAYIEMR
jgi:GH24 family phage-related lysozyme (muramidase)